MFLIDVGNLDKQSFPQVGKVLIFKLQVCKVFFGQITGGQIVISTYFYLKKHRVRPPNYN